VAEFPITGLSDPVTGQIVAVDGGIARSAWTIEPPITFL
jgi:hypothetical protein